MFCVKCGASLPDDANFCFICGCDLRNLSQGSKTESPAVKVGDYVKFGSYPQNNSEVKEPIEWLALEVNDNEALLISRYGLDCKQYHHEATDITWEASDLRKWLNYDFMKAAFSEEEQRRIKLSEIINDDNPKYGTRGGNNTQDRVFCLSLAEAERYFRNDSERMCWPSVLIKDKKYVAGEENGHCCWWLRSPGAGNNNPRLFISGGASDVARNGSLQFCGIRENWGGNAVRPALRLKL